MRDNKALFMRAAGTGDNATGSMQAILELYGQLDLRVEGLVS